jgi:hypothetical protein
VELIRDHFERQGKDPEAFVRFHVRRLEALRRAGHVERIDAEHWRIPEDLVERGMAYDLDRGGHGRRVRTLSMFGSDGATWLDRELVASGPVPLAKTGFGLEVTLALDRRAERLVETGHAKREADGASGCHAILLRALSGKRSSAWERK